MVRMPFAVACFILLSLTNASGSEWTRTTIPTKTTPDSQNLWLRCFLQVPDRLVTPEGGERDLWRSSTVLAVSDLPGQFEIFLNSQSIVKSDGIPLGKEQRFKVPKDVLEKNQFNALVIRIDHKTAAHGFTSAPVLIDYFNELILDQEWEFTSTKPSGAELKASQKKPAFAAYPAHQFKLSSRPLARTMDPIRGRQVPPGEDLALLKTADDLAVGFAGCFLVKKCVQGHASVTEGSWDSIHVVEAVEASDGASATYKLTSTVMLTMDVNKPSLDSNLSGCMVRQKEVELPVRMRTRARTEGAPAVRRVCHA